MSRSARAAATAVLLAAALPGAARAAAGSSPAPHAVRIINQRGYWTGLGAPGALGDGIRRLFVISGELRNVGRQRLAYVALRFELLDAGGTVVASERGYNHGAEDLRRPDYEAGIVSRAQLHLTALAPGGQDTFRMLFVGGDVPRFRRWRVRVVGVGYE